MLSEMFQKVLSEYLQEKIISYTKTNEIARLLTKDIPEELASHLSNKEAYIVDGSAGKGN